jgi:hypothetical protein
MHRKEEAIPRVRLRLIVSLGLATVSAYTFSFALDLLFGGLLHVYPTNAFLPVVSWSLLSFAVLFAAFLLVGGVRWLAIPHVGFGLFASLSGMIGTAHYSLIVGGILLLEAFLVWGNSHRPRPLERESGIGTGSTHLD